VNNLNSSDLKETSSFPSLFLKPLPKIGIVLILNAVEEISKNRQAKNLTIDDFNALIFT
jgi:hypothetical protein